MTESERTLLVSPLSGTLLSALADRITPGMTLVTPNVRAGISVTRRLPSRVRVLTLTQAARNALRKAGWRLLRPGTRERLLQGVIHDLPLEWLHDVQDRASTAASLLGLISELERAHISPTELLRVASIPRERDVARIYAAYHGACVEQKVYDAAGSEHFAALLEHITPVAVAISGFFYLDAAQIAFAQILCAPGSVMTLPDGPGAAPRTAETVKAFQEQGWATVALTGPAETLGDHVTTGYLSGCQVDDLAMTEAADIDAEIRHALQQARDWLQEGVPPEQIALIVRNENRYVETLADVGREYRIPLLSGVQRSLRETGLGRVVEAWHRAHTRGWTFDAVRELLTNPLLEWGWTVERAHALQGSRPGGLDAWDPALRWLALPAETTRGHGVHALRQLFQEGGIFPRCTRDPELNRLVTFLFKWLRTDARQDVMCPRETVLAEISAALYSATQPVLNTRSGVRVLNPLGALGRQFRCVVMLGLSDGLFPVRRSDHALIDAATRQAWAVQGVILPDLTTLASVEEALVLGCVATAQEALVVTRPRRDADDTPLAPSPFWTRLRPGRSRPERRPGSALEREVQRARDGHASPRARVGAGRERDRAARELTSHSGQIPQGIDVASREWTLLELQTASLCRMRWFSEYALGVLDHERVWTALRRAALDGAVRAVGQPLDAQLLAASHAIDGRAAFIQRTTGWSPGPLWAVKRSELLVGTGRILQHRDWLPDTAQRVQATHIKRVTVRAGGHTLTIRFRIDRRHSMGEATHVTLYRARPAGWEQRTALSADHVLALTIAAAEVASGQYLSLDTGQTSGALLHVEDEDHTSPALQARKVLANVMDALMLGDVRPMAVDARICGACPIRTICRAGVAA